jgi:hypothetical protein
MKLQWFAQLVIVIVTSAVTAFVTFQVVDRDGDAGPRFAFDDVRDYCSTVETLDEPDIRWVGKPTPDEVHEAAIAKFTEQIVGPNEVLWRCMDGEVWWCLQWGTSWCPQRDVSMEASPRMYEICARETEDRPLSRAEYGRATVWSWSCRAGRPVPDLTPNYSAIVDRRYFTAALWVSLEDGRNPATIE